MLDGLGLMVLTCLELKAKPHPVVREPLDGIPTVEGLRVKGLGSRV